MSSLSSFKRRLNIEKVQIAQQRAWEKAEAKKADSQRGKEIDPKLIQKVFEVVEENKK